MADEDVEEETQGKLEVAEDDVEQRVVEVKPVDPPLYQVRPTLGQKFKAAAVKYIITSSMEEQLLQRQYRADQVPRWCKTIANGIRQRVQELDMKRFTLNLLDFRLLLKDAQLRAMLFGDCALQWLEPKYAVYKAYKIVVQTTIFEMRGAGIKCAQRCIWDPETDDYVDDIFRSDTLYCHSIVYGLYMY